jgi:adenylosuccinate lyase
LRREAYPNPYEALKGLNRTNEAIDKKAIHNFIATLDISAEIKTELMQITPSNFLGI